MLPAGGVEWKFEDYLRAVFVHKFTLTLIMFTFSMLAYFREAQKPDIYQASTRILIEDDSSIVEFRRKNIPRGGGPQNQQFLRTEYLLIHGPEITGKVVERLNLDSFPPFSSSDYPSEVLSSMVEVRPVRGTNLVDIVATGIRPELVARIADTTSEIYAEFNLERRLEKSGGGTRWLQEELVWTEKKMRNAQLELQEFIEQHQSIDFSAERQNTIFQRIDDLNKTITDIRKQRIEAETRYRQKHPTLVKLQKREEELRAAFKEQEQRALEFTRLSIQYNILQRNAKTSEGIYDVLLQRLKELSVEGNLQGNNIQIISTAKVPKSPIGPNRKQGIFFGIFVGLLLGCGQAILREMMAKTFRTRREFELLLQMPFLGYLPDIKMPRTHKDKEKLFLLKMPQSTEAEALRSARTTVEFLLPKQESHSMLVTSAIPEEGKSFVSISLAIGLQELGREVVFIDADMRRPTVHSAFNISLEPGLSSYLKGEADVSQITQVIPEAKNLAVITAGNTPSQPTDLLVSDKMTGLLAQLKEMYQYVILDTPPVLAVADTTALSSLVEGVIFVVRAGRTPRDVSLTGKTRLTDVGAKIIGGILNGSLPERRYTHYYYYQGSKRPRR